ncbi:ATP-binding protein [Nonlabens sp.]|uniref:PAS domain-containing sensor histidine kinase n=1 Tax=Nonlabens sp. TaxID=1888209 RepID=UPI003F69E97A
MDSFQKDTEKKLAMIKSSFEKNNELSYEIFEQMPIGICITDIDGYFTDVNTTYCDTYGYTKEELIGKLFTTVVPDEYTGVLNKLHDDFFEKQSELQGRWTVQDKNKQQFEIITNAAFLYDEDTKVKKKMTLVVKALELNLTIQRLKTTIDILENKIETQDIANRLAEHDMRNRLSSMVSIASILSKSELNPDQTKWVRMLKNIGKDTIKLLTSAKDFAMMERGKYIPEISSFDLIGLIANETSDLKELIEEKEASFSLFHEEKECDPGTDKIIMKGDEFYLQHLFQNLLRNALEASPHQETIKIEIETDALFTVKISNKGVIPEQIRDSFFDKYTTSGKERGTGLGTYISKMIAEIHNGTLSFLTNEEDGTALTLKLPKEILSIH